MKRILACVLLENVVYVACMLQTSMHASNTQAPVKVDESGSATPGDTSKFGLQARVDSILLVDQVLAKRQEAFAIWHKAQHLPEDEDQRFLDAQNSTSEQSNDPFVTEQRSLVLNFVIVLAELILCSLVHCLSFTALAPVFKKVGMHVVIGAIVLVVCIALCLLTWSEVYWVFDSEARTLYLDKTGTLFVMETAMISVLTPIIFYQFQKHAEALQQKEVEGTGTDAKHLKINYEDLRNFAKMVMRGVFNGGMVVSMVASLSRDPNERMNGAKYIVILFEYLYYFIHVVCILGSTVGFIGVKHSVSRGVYVKLAVHNLQQISGSSFLQSFPFAHPMSFFDDLTWSSLMNVATIIKIINIPMGFLGLFVRVDLLSFIGGVNMGAWTIADYAQLGSFINHLAGMLPNTNNVGISAIFHAVDPKSTVSEATAKEHAWRTSMCEELSKEHGSWRAMAKYCNLHAGDIDLETLKGDLKKFKGDQMNGSETKTGGGEAHRKYSLCC